MKSLGGSERQRQGLWIKTFRGMPLPFCVSSPTFSAASYPRRRQCPAQARAARNCTDTRDTMNKIHLSSFVYCTNSATALRKAGLLRGLPPLFLPMSGDVALVTLGYVSGLPESHVKHNVSIASIQILSFGTSRITSDIYTSSANGNEHWKK